MFSVDRSACLNSASGLLHQSWDLTIQHGIHRAKKHVVKKKSLILITWGWVHN